MANVMCKSERKNSEIRPIDSLRGNNHTLIVVATDLRSLLISHEHHFQQPDRTSPSELGGEA